MISLDFVQNFIIENYPKNKNSKKNTHWNFRCPYCGDSKKSKNKIRFHLDYNKGNPGFKCFNCNVHGNFLDFYSFTRNIDIDKAKNEIFGDKIKYFKEKPTFDYIDEKQELVDQSWILDYCIDENTLTDSLFKKNGQKLLRQFKEQRKIDYSIYFCYNGRFANRIIIPIYQDEKLIYFQGRAIDKNVEPKYLNLKLPNRDIIFNKENFDKEDDIIITEGLIDALSIEKNATTTFTRGVDKESIIKIKNLTNKNIIVCFDNDESGKESILNLINIFENFSWIKFFVFPNIYEKCNDINEIKTKYNINIYEMVKKNSFTPLKTKMKLRS